MRLSLRLRGNGSNFPATLRGAIAQLAERLDRTTSICDLLNFSPSRRRFRFAGVFLALMFLWPDIDVAGSSPFVPDYVPGWKSEPCQPMDRP
jgi:hypothetical protein